MLHASIPNEEYDDDQFDTDLELDETKCEGKQSLTSSAVENISQHQNLTKEMPETSTQSGSTLLLKHHGLSDDDVVTLGHAISRNQEVEIINLEDNHITPKGISFLCQFVPALLTHLVLSNNEVGRLGSLALKDLLTIHESLTHLILSNCKIRDSDGVHIADGVKSSGTIVSLDLSQNELSEESAVALGSMLANNTSLEELNLAWNHIRRKGAIQLCTGLKRNSYLVQVNLSWNGLGYEGALALSEALKKNKSLRMLDISSNRLTWLCAAVIAKGLNQNQCLEILKMGLNPLSMTGAWEIVNAANNELSQVQYVSFEGVPINRKLSYLVEKLSKVRPFTIVHGGLLDTADVFGQRIIEEDDPLTRLISFLSDRGMRAIDLFRSLEKGQGQVVSRSNFIDGLMKAKVPLEEWEMQYVIDHLDTTDDGYIDFRKLSTGMKDQKLSNKRDVVAKKQAQQKKVQEEKRLLQGTELPHIPTRDALTPSTFSPLEDYRRASVLSQASERISKRLAASRLSSVLSLPSSVSTSMSMAGAHRRTDRDQRLIHKFERVLLPRIRQNSVSSIMTQSL